MEEYEVRKFQFKTYFDDSSSSKLKAYLGHVEKGNDEDYRTPLFNGRPREDVLDEWQPVLERKLAGMEGLLEFENTLREKVGPLSIMKPYSERLEDIEAYYSGIHLKSKPLSSDALDALIKEWGSVRGLSLRSQAATWDKMKKSTSSGEPFFSKRRDVINKTMPCKMVGDEIAYPIGRKFKPCAILGWRGQEGGLEDSDVKQRVIWMFPMAYNILELQFYQPLIEACQRFNLVPAWNGNNSVDEEVTALFDTKGKDDVIVATDFTKFDQHFNYEMQVAAQKIFKALDAPQEWLDEVCSSKFSIPLLGQMDEMWYGEHGMPSGSGGTNADETSSHRCLQHEAAITSHAELNRHSMCLGDDGLLSYPGISVDHVLDVYTSHGLEMNESKQFVSKTEAEYLRRWYSTEYRINGISRGVYSTYRALGKLMGQERFYDPDLWGPEMLVMRSLSIIENCKWHPAKEEFLEFCVKGDKYRLGLDIPGFFDNLAKSYESNELAQSFKSYTAGDEVGINDWWCVKALRAMR
jgi:hypothetical protein